MVVRCAWLSIFRFLFLSDSVRHPVQFAARTLDPALRLLLLRGVHLRQSFGQPAAGAPQNGKRHLRIALHLFHRRRFCERRPALRFQKQFRFGENALTNHARAFPPGGVKLRCLPRIAAVLHEYRGHALAVFGTDSRHRHQILHRDLRGEVSFAHLKLDCFGQQCDERQTPRNPAHAAVEAARQFVKRITEAMLQRGNQKPEFGLHFRRIGPSVGDFLAEELAIALAKPVNSHLERSFRRVHFASQCGIRPLVGLDQEQIQAAR